MSNSPHRILLASLMLAFAAMTAWGGGAVRYGKSELPTLDGPADAGLGLKPGETLKISVMPMSITASTDEKIAAATGSQEFKQKAWDALKSAVGAARFFEHAALPEGAEKDEVIEKTMKYAMGLLPVSEFKKVKSFALPERFLYGALTIELKTEEQLGRPDKVTFHAEAFLRLVEGTTMKYVPAVAVGEAAGLDDAVRLALQNAVQKYAPKEAAAKGGDEAGGSKEEKKKESAKPEEKKSHFFD